MGFSLGSPAEKADLEVADEILEINGQSLENSNHTDVIAHIHNVGFDWDCYSIILQSQRHIHSMFHFNSALNRGQYASGSKDEQETS